MQREKSVLAAAVLAVMTGAAHAGDVTFSGFLTVGGGVADDEDAVGYAGYEEDDLTFDTDTVFGLQVSSAVTEQLTVTGQLVARGTDDYDVDAEWAYVSYAFSDSFTGRMGRLRTPLYLYSDYVDVGYAYSWLRAPREVYYLPFNNFQGVDFVWNFPMGSLDGTVQWYYGALTDSFFNTDIQADLDTQLRGQTGLAFTLSYDWLTLRAAYHTADLSIDAPPNPTVDGLAALLRFNGFNDNADRLYTVEDKGTFKQIGFTVDTGMFVAAGESVEFEVEDTPFSIDKRKYLMLGLRFGDFLIHVTGAEIEDEAADLASGIPVSAGTAPLIAGLNLVANQFVAESETVSVGLRWDFTSSAALKIQVDDITDNKIDQPSDVDNDQRVIAFGISTVF